ncbi:hypothetical protein ACQEWB_44520 [Streptomyces sp. CA-249302]|uniref:hypothetical protein n=1 Tax=Streptomyces sp. CA-249302 TaxID=3240058 RepID=UPI003D93E092
MDQNLAPTAAPLRGTRNEGADGSDPPAPRGPVSGAGSVLSTEEAFQVPPRSQELSWETVAGPREGARLSAIERFEARGAVPPATSASKPVPSPAKSGKFQRLKPLPYATEFSTVQWQPGSGRLPGPAGEYVHARSAAAV